MKLTYSRLVHLIAGLAFILAVSPGAAFAQNDESIVFNRDVRPILSNGCFNCHGPNAATRQAGLRLDVADGPVTDRGRYGGPVIIPGNAEESLLFHRVTEENARARMPRGGDALTAEQIDTIRRWIDQGAEWQPHWAFIPPERSTLPNVAQVEWPRNPIDRFVLSRLEEDALAPAVEAEGRRRRHRPPTPTRRRKPLPRQPRPRPKQTKRRRRQRRLR